MHNGAKSFSSLREGPVAGRESSSSYARSPSLLGTADFLSSGLDRFIALTSSGVSRNSVASSRCDVCRSNLTCHSSNQSPMLASKNSPSGTIQILHFNGYPRSLYLVKSARPTRPRLSPENRPYVISSKPANGIGRRRDCFTLPQRGFARRGLEPMSSCLLFRASGLLLLLCHSASPVLPVLVRQLRGPHLRTCP